jgi:hypothetical protein
MTIQPPPTPEDLAGLAAKLTEAQRRAICTLAESPRARLSGDQIFMDYQRAGIRQRRTRQFLTNSGITEPYQRGPVVIWAMIRLTPLGLALRSHIQESNRS